MTFDANTIIIVVAILAALILAFLLLRPRRQRIDIESKPAEQGYVATKERPYMAAASGADPVLKEAPAPRADVVGSGVVDEAAVAARDVAGQVLGVECATVDDETGSDDLQKLKGVGPKLVAQLHALGIRRYEQLATLNDTELAMLDEKLGAFRGRLARDRVVEQALYLARGDLDGFEAKFGKVGS